MSEEGEEDENSLEAYSSKEGEGPIWLFFGCRRRDADWIYRPEMEAFLGQGTCFGGRVVVADLTWREPAVSIAHKRHPPPYTNPAGVLTELHTAFSREDPAKGKVYVQHRMLEQGDRLARLLLQVSEKERDDSTWCPQPQPTTQPSNKPSDHRRRGRTCTCAATPRTWPGTCTRPSASCWPPTGEQTSRRCSTHIGRRTQPDPPCPSTSNTSNRQGSMRGSEDEAEAFLQELKQRQRYVLDIWT